jgi:hypothetical protein
MSNDPINAIRNGDVRVIEATRGEVRDFMDTLNEENSVAERLHNELDEAQAEADSEGKKIYVLIQINGHRL